LVEVEPGPSPFSSPRDYGVIEQTCSSVRS